MKTTWHEQMIQEILSDDNWLRRLDPERGGLMLHLAAEKLDYYELHGSTFELMFGASDGEGT